MLASRTVGTHEIFLRSTTDLRRHDAALFPDSRVSALFLPDGTRRECPRPPFGNIVISSHNVTTTNDIPFILLRYLFLARSSSLLVYLFRATARSLALSRTHTDAHLRYLFTYRYEFFSSLRSTFFYSLSLFHFTFFGLTVSHSDRWCGDYDDKSDRESLPEGEVGGGLG